MFRHSTEISLKSIDYLPKFWSLSWDKVEFYSEKDMENLPEETQKTFREIEKNPTIIVDWKDYTPNYPAVLKTPEKIEEEKNETSSGSEAEQ